MTSKIGFEDDEIIWLHSYFTDVKIVPSTISLAEIEAILLQLALKKLLAASFVTIIHKMIWWWHVTFVRWTKMLWKQ
ncbi:MAG: hypothetical protein ACLS3S_08580 [Streptococcus salivarius]